MSHRRLTRRGARLLALATLLGTSLTAITTTTADADTFTPTPDPPSIAPFTLTEQTNPSTAIYTVTPAHPRSTDTYTLSVPVDTAGGVPTLASIEMCWWLEAVSDCDSATPDPETAFEMSWALSGTPGNYTETFTVTDGDSTAYEDAGSTTDFAAGNFRLNVDFTFKVSSAMRHASSWNIRVTATDSAGQSSEFSDTNYRVNYYGSVNTGRAAQSWGVVTMGRNVTRDGIATGTYTANSESRLTMAASDFTNGATTLPIVASAAARELEMRCSLTDSYSQGNALTLVGGGGASQIGVQNHDVTVNLTPESPQALPLHSCRLSYPAGRATDPNDTYSNTITVGIVADAVTKPVNLASGTVTPDSVQLTWVEPPVIGTSIGGTTVAMDNYVIEQSSDGGATWSVYSTLTTGFNPSMSTTVANLSPRSSYSFRVTANSDAGSGSSEITVNTGSNATDTPALLQTINDAVRYYSEDTSVSTVRAALENINVAGGLSVVATPTYKNVAESMSSQNGALTTEGVFNRQAFNSAAHLEPSGGFGDNSMNGQPYLGFIGFARGKFYGSGVMLYEDYAGSTTTELRDFFYPNQYRNLDAYVLNADGTYRSYNDGTGVGSTQTIFSDGHSPGSRGYYSTNRFARDDGAWGFNYSERLNGNSTTLTHTRGTSSGAYGAANQNSGDSNAQTFYWDTTRISTTDYLFYFFVVYAD